MCIPVHAPWLPGYIDVAQTILIILTMVGHFPDRSLALSRSLSLSLSIYIYIYEKMYIYRENVCVYIFVYLLYNHLKLRYYCGGKILFKLGTKNKAIYQILCVI